MKLVIAALIFSFSHLAIAQETPPPPAPVPENAPVAQEKDTDIHFGIGASLRGGNALYFSETKVGGSSTKYEVTADYSTGVSLELDARMLAQDSWGFIGGLTIDSETKAEKVTIKDGSSTQTITASDGAKLQATVLYGSLAYRMERFYIPFGLNVAAIKFTPPSGYSGSAEASGGLGIQAGMGYYFSPNFVGETHLRSIGVKLKSTPTTGSEVDYGNGGFVSFLLTAKYIF